MTGNVFIMEPVSKDVTICLGYISEQKGDNMLREEFCGKVLLSCVIIVVCLRRKTAKIQRSFSLINQKLTQLLCRILKTVRKTYDFRSHICMFIAIPRFIHVKILSCYVNIAVFTETQHHCTSRGFQHIWSLSNVGWLSYLEGIMSVAFKELFSV